MLNIKGHIAHLKAFHPDAKKFLWATFCISLSANIFSLVFNLYVLSLGHSRAYLGTLEALPAAAVAVFALPAGYLCSRLPFKKSLLIAISLSLIATAGLAASSGAGTLMLFRVFSGLSTAMMTAVTWPLLVKFSTTEERNWLFSFQFFISTMAGFAGSMASGQLALLGARLIGHAPDSPQTYQFTIAASCVMLGLALIPLYRMAGEQGNGERGGFELAGLDWKRVLRAYAPQMGIAYGAGMIMPFVNVFLKTKFNLPIDKLGLCMSLQAFAMAIGSLTAPYFVKKCGGRVGAMTTVQALSLPFLALMGFTPLLWVTMIGLWMRTMLMNTSGPIYSVFLMEHFEEKHRPVISAAYGIAWNTCWSIGASTSGKMQMGWGFDMPFMATLVTYASATLLLMAWFSPGGDSRTLDRGALAQSAARAGEAE